MRAAAIVGTGLIGGSFGLALRKAGFQGAIIGVSSERSIAEAVARGAVDRGRLSKKPAPRPISSFCRSPFRAFLPRSGNWIRGPARLPGDGRGQH